MYEMVRTERGWVVCWGGATLTGVKEVKAEEKGRAVVVVAEEARPEEGEAPATLAV